MVQNLNVARRQVAMSNESGLHLRVAHKFVNLANTFKSEIRVHCNEIMADGRSILSLLCLAQIVGR